MPVVDNTWSTTKHVQIVKRKPARSKNHSADDARWHRIAVWAVLVGICRKIERLQTSWQAKQACREVSERLHAILDGERSELRTKRG